MSICTMNKDIRLHFEVKKLQIDFMFPESWAICSAPKSESPALKMREQKKHRREALIAPWSPRNLLGAL